MKQFYFKTINQQLRTLTECVVERTARHGCIAAERAQRVGHMVGLRSERGLRSNLASAFADRGIYVGIRGNCIRVSPHLHTTTHAIDRFMSALEDVSR
jgi:selenocysteine lyase/cysteine desulfurase